MQDIFFDYIFPIETNTAVTIYQTLSISEFNENNLVLYPNPTDSSVTVKSSALINNIDIYDVRGALIASLRVEEFNPLVDVSKLEKGVYFLTINSEDFISVQKVIKN